MSSLPHRWRHTLEISELRPILLAATFAATVVLGFFGYRDADPHLGAATTFYQSLQLFVLDGGVVPGKTPWPLEIARFLAPAAVGYAAIRGAMLIARDQLIIWRTRLLARDHVVVAGDSDLMATIAARMIDAGQKVVVLSLDSALLEGHAERGATVLGGDPRDALVIARARPDRAADVVIASASDADALRILAACEEASSTGHGPGIHVALNDPRLWEELHSAGLAAGDDSRRVEFFLAGDREARVLLNGVNSSRLLIEGEGVILERLLTLAARAALLDARTVEVTLGPRAMASSRQILAETPWLAEALKIRDAVEPPMGGEFVALVGGLGDGPGIAYGARLARASSQATVRVAVADAAIDGALSRSRLRAANLEILPVTAVAMGSALLADSAVEIIARAKHEDYVARELARDAASDNPSVTSWEALPDSLKASNRHYAESVARKLLSLGATLTPLTASRPFADLELPESVLEDLAQGEHDRWMNDLLADGWQRTEGAKDPNKKLHPLLVDWTSLDDSEREKDRDGFRALPSYLARAGYALLLPNARRDLMSDGLKIFISYRREDCMVHAGRLAENLQTRTDANVFLDVDSIPPGVSFPDYIQQAIDSCDVVLVMIGDDWLDITGHDGQPRLASAEDWVHMEIAEALQRGVLTIPVLVEGARMPRPDQLPVALTNLALRNAAELRDQSWSRDVDALINALPSPTRESLDNTQHVEPLWPGRFTDQWFSRHVPSMTEPTLRSLRAELYQRNWSDDDINTRVMIHAGDQTNVSESGPRAAGPSEVALAVGDYDESDPVARATFVAADDLARLALDPAAKIRERQLSLALGRHLVNSVVERKVHVPGWDPQPGNVDVFTVDENGRPVLIVEAKLKDGNEIFECLWDMAKALSLATAEGVEAVYLVTGSTVASWARPVACAELFATGQHELVGSIEQHREWWIKYILGDSRGRPAAVPDLMDVCLVADIRYEVRGVDWQLKAIRIATAASATWVPFVDGLPDRFREPVDATTPATAVVDPDVRAAEGADRPEQPGIGVGEVNPWVREELEAAGFTGWVRWLDCPAALSAISSAAGGVYVIYRESPDPPEFVARSRAGTFRGDPSVGLDALQDNWVQDAHVVYIGKADHGRLRKRLAEYIDFGRGGNKRHWGGRLIWQLPDAENLLVAWHELSTEQDALENESELIAAFRRFHHKAPFANDPHRLGA